MKSSRAGLKWVKVRRFLTLFFNRNLLATYLSVPRFEDVPIERLIQDGIQGVLVDADGTLGPDGAHTYSRGVVDHIQQMRRAGLKAALYTNAGEDRFSQFHGVEVVSDVHPKPDPRGFSSAMTRFLGMTDPSRVCMIGDNYITDGGAVEAGMRFLHVHPIPGGENAIHRFTRYLAWRQAQRGSIENSTRPVYKG